MRLTINLFLALVFPFIFISCNENKEESKLKDYFTGLHIPTKKTSVIVVDPTYCGSCTKYTISWINKHRSKNQYQNYFILTTDTIPQILSKDLNSNKFKIIEINGNQMKRLGYGGFVSYNFTFNKNGDISKQIIKRY